MELKGNHFLNTNELNEARGELLPVVTTIFDGKGISIDYSEVLKDTISLSVIRQKDESQNGGNKKTKHYYNKTDYNNKIKLFFKDGCVMMQVNRLSGRAYQ